MSSIGKFKINMYDNRQIFYFTIITLAFISGVRYPEISICVGILGYFFCFINMLKGNMVKAYLNYITFITLSIEVSYFATGIRDGVTVYSFIVLPFFTIYCLLILNVLFYIYLRIQNKKKDIFGQKNKKMKSLYKVINYMLFIGILMFLITYLLNDNGIYNQQWYIQMSISEGYRFSILFFTIQNCIMLLSKYEDFYIKLGRVLKNLLLSLAPSGLLAVLFGFDGYRAGQDNILMLPLYAFFGIALFILPQYKAFKCEKKKIYVYACLLLFIMILRPTPLGGKWFLAILIVVFAILYKTTPIKTIITFFSILCLIFISIKTNILESLFINNDYLLLKYKEAQEMLSAIFNLTSYEISGSSSSFRFDEFSNILLEYKEKPYFLLLGKGIVGTLIHHSSILSWDGVGAFSAAQQEAGVFIRVHETLNLIFLKYGLIGLVGLFKLCSYGIKSIKKSPWGVVGIIWLIFFVGAYQTMLFGAVALTLGIYESSK